MVEPDFQFKVLRIYHALFFYIVSVCKVTIMRKAIKKSSEIFAYLKIIRTFASLLKGNTSEESFGEVAEWSIAAVLKTGVPRGTRGSNPCLSASHAEYQQGKN